LAVDLGCGIGSVLLMVAWRFPGARVVGIEAQPVSVALARRSIEWNGATARVEVRAGDLRDPAPSQDLSGRAGLVSGTPPYFAPGRGVESPLPQRGPCRFEHRGGIEGYCQAAARLLAPGAPFVAVEGAGQRVRVEDAAREAGLAVERWREVVPRAGKGPLFSVMVMRREGEAARPIDEAPLVVRDRDRRWTEEFRAIRAAFGMPSAA
jgi:tRNA1(Val) A37 N6-methylase TrmN6